jgi:hypothetical protein
MEDTTQAAARIVHEAIMAKTIEERFLMCAEMYEEAKEFARIGMPAGLSVEEQNLFIFRRIHGATPQEIVNKS